MAVPNSFLVCSDTSDSLSSNTFLVCIAASVANSVPISGPLGGSSGNLGGSSFTSVDNSVFTSSSLSLPSSISFIFFSNS